MGNAINSAVLARPFTRAIAARKDMQKMIDEGAPAGVVAAAQELIYCAETGGTPRADTRGVLLSWSALRQGQDRYGKSLLN